MASSERVCVVCGNTFAYERNDVTIRGNLPMVCSKLCRSRRDARIKEQRNPRMEKRVVDCHVCSVQFLSSFQHQVFCSPLCRRIATADRAKQMRDEIASGRVYVFKCDFCGLDIIREKFLGGVKRFHPVCSIEARKARDRAKTMKRQGLSVRSATSLIKIVERDGWVCWLCTEVIDSSIPRTDRLGATVDHVVPLFHGGTDDLENLRLAHKSCNSSKGKKLINAKST